MYGGVWKICLGNHIYTTTLKYKKNSHTSSPQYSSIQSIRDIPRNPQYLLYLQYLLYSLVFGKFPVLEEVLEEVIEEVIEEVFEVFEVFPVFGKFPVFIILPLCHLLIDQYYYFFVN